MSEKIFSTKTGYCHISPDRIVLTRNGITGDVVNSSTGSTIKKALIIYLVISAYFFYKGFTLFAQGAIIEAVLYSFMAVFLLIVTINSRNNSAVATIQRDSIVRVSFKKAIPLITRSYFEVFFKDETGAVKKRLIMLAGSLSDGKSEAENALKIIKEEGLIK